MNLNLLLEELQSTQSAINTSCSDPDQQVTSRGFLLLGSIINTTFRLRGGAEQDIHEWEYYRAETGPDPSVYSWVALISRPLTCLKIATIFSPAKARQMEQSGGFFYIQPTGWVTFQGKYTSSSV